MQLAKRSSFGSIPSMNNTVLLDIADIAVIRKDTLPAALAALSCTPVPVLSFHPNRSGSACFFKTKETLSTFKA